MDGSLAIAKLFSRAGLYYCDFAPALSELDPLDFLSLSSSPGFSIIISLCSVFSVLSNSYERCEVSILGVFGDLGSDFLSIRSTASILMHSFSGPSSSVFYGSGLFGASYSLNHHHYHHHRHHHPIKSLQRASPSASSFSPFFCHTQSRHGTRNWGPFKRAVTIWVAFFPVLRT